MKYYFKLLIAFSFLFILSALFGFNNVGKEKELHFAYKNSGLTERQAAAHLIGRFTFGAKPGQVDEVLKVGLEKWFLNQLEGALPDDNVNERLKMYDALKLTNSEVLQTYPRATQVLKMAEKDGFIQKDKVDVADKKDYKKQLEPYYKLKGFKPQQELFRQFANQKILRAVYSNNQLHELLTDFWFNHFNVSISKNQCAEYIPAYERDIIRPNVTGKFEDLLIATAKSPAMLMYLDNFSSSGTNSSTYPATNERFRNRMAKKMGERLGDTSTSELMDRLAKAKKGQGLNENYAREVMELHTLGVDGGYTQQDVTNAAKILTGWTLYPNGEYGQGENIRKLLEAVGEENLVKRGFVHEGDFLFAVNRHDNSEKVVLGKVFLSGGGYDEGVQLLKMLAHHPSTASFVCKKIASRFVQDQPSEILVKAMSNTFIQTDGNIKKVLLTMVASPEFWSKEAMRAKTKSPFELAISAVRSMNADIQMPYALYQSIEKMGQKLYYYQAPTGFPDNGQYWINTGSLLNRMNFGLALANNKINGIKINLLALNNNHEPESAEDALVKYSKLIMPERNMDETIKRLKPLLSDPSLVNKIEQAASAIPVSKQGKQNAIEGAMMDDASMDEMQSKFHEGRNRQGSQPEMPGANTMLSQVVGIIIGSPEFQRR